MLSREVGGIRSFFEADAVAAQFEKPIHAGEVKSFPTVDGQADPEKVGSAIAQVAIYILLLRDVVAQHGGKDDLVSSSALLITPRNTGMQPTMTVKSVGREIDRADRILRGAPSAAELATLVNEDVPTFETISDRDLPEEQRVDAAHAIAEKIGTRYRPECLASCGMARFCRERANQASDPARVGSPLMRLLPRVESIARVGEIVDGAPPTPAERPVAEQLLRAERLRRTLVPTEGPSSRRRTGT